MNAIQLFEGVKRIDWANFEAASVQTQAMLRQLAGDKKLMRRLLMAAPETPALWNKCENDVVEDKIVLWDDPAREVRIRLRISTANQSRLAHSHRFSFSNLVLRGSYIHWGYAKLAEFNEHTRLDDVREVFMHEDQAGDCFSIHYAALHSTPFPVPGTVSLVLRGNPVRERAPVMFKEARQRESAAREQSGAGMQQREVEPSEARAGQMFWRVGEELEPEERRAERRMSMETFCHWVDKLEEWEII